MITIRDKIYKRFKGKTVQTQEIVHEYNKHRSNVNKGALATFEKSYYAKLDVYPVVLRKLMNEGKAKRISRGIYKFK